MSKIHTVSTNEIEDFEYERELAAQIDVRYGKKKLISIVKGTGVSFEVFDNSKSILKTLSLTYAVDTYNKIDIRQPTKQE